MDGVGGGGVGEEEGNDLDSLEHLYRVESVRGVAEHDVVRGAEASLHCKSSRGDFPIIHYAEGGAARVESRKQKDPLPHSGMRLVLRVLESSSLCLEGEEGEALFQLKD